MISYIEGTIINLSPDTLTVKANQIGYEIMVTQKLLLSTKLDESISLWLDTVIGERDIRLFGFTYMEEREMFRLLNSVSGIGPKSALGVLNVSTPDRIKDAIVNDSVELFTAVSGIGRKNASRIIIELKNRFTNNDKIDTARLNQKHEDAKDVVEALTKLGYKRKEIDPILANIDPTLTTEEKIKQVLKQL